MTFRRDLSTRFSTMQVPLLQQLRGRPANPENLSSRKASGAVIRGSTAMSASMAPIALANFAP
jgi:hypothetical protein